MARIEHAALYVNDLEAARAFFAQYFGAVSNDGYHNSQTGFRSYFLSFDGGARLEIMNRPEVRGSGGMSFRAGYSHLAFSVGSREKVDELTARLKQDGYEVASGPRVTGDGYYESCIIAFEGNLVEITV
ncbi:MAG: VOC family protein [Succinivibrionaceae bacterium]|nr:VOC family protein [Succinivibrionaceae bacterium]